MKFLPKKLNEKNIIDILRDLKHRVYPRPFERLALNGKKDLVGAEIGVFEGDHALSLFENLDIRKLYLIDPYELYDDYFEGKKHYGHDQPPLNLAKVNAYKKLDEYTDRIVWIEKYSNDAVSEIDEELDFVYIDGNHQETYVLDDIINYLPIVKRGRGVIGGHDFYNGFQRDHDGVVNAVVKYAIKNHLDIQVELPDWWFQL